MTGADQYAPGAPAQVWAMRGLSDGEKLVLLWLWSRADHDVQRRPIRCTVWAPSYTAPDGSQMAPGESLIEDIRQNVLPDKAARTIRGHLKRLRDRGLAHDSGRCVDLVPPVCLAPDRQDPATNWRDPATNWQDPAGEILPKSGGFLPQTGEILPKSGENRPLQLNPPVPPDPQRQQTPPAQYEPDSPEVRHREIVESQRRLAEPEPPEAKLAPSPSRVTDPLILAVHAAGDAWATDLMRSTWERGLRAAVAALSLTPEQVTAVLRAWDAAWARLPAHERAQVEASKHALPARHSLWSTYSSSRAWIADALAGLTPAASSVGDRWRGAGAAYDPLAKYELLAGGAS